jgi:hypothetical protein
MGLAADHLLLEHRGHERLEKPPAAADPQVLVTARQLGDDRVLGGEAGTFVVVAELGRQAVEQPARARPPRLAGHQGAAEGACGGTDKARSDAQRSGPFGGQRGAPHCAGPVSRVRGITAAAAVHG